MMTVEQQNRKQESENAPEKPRVGFAHPWGGVTRFFDARAFQEKVLFQTKKK